MVALIPIIRPSSCVVGLATWLAITILAEKILLLSECRMYSSWWHLPLAMFWWHIWYPWALPLQVLALRFRAQVHERDNRYYQPPDPTRQEHN